MIVVRELLRWLLVLVISRMLSVCALGITILPVARVICAGVVVVGVFQRIVEVRGSEIVGLVVVVLGLGVVGAHVIALLKSLSVQNLLGLVDYLHLSQILILSDF